MDLPNKKKFIFTIIDDTDDAFTETIKPIYDLLHKNGLRITKTVWVYPVRDVGVSKGDSLQDIGYKEFVLDIKAKGFEIALHNVGSGDFTREEIISGLDEFKDVIGAYPTVHVNHSYNPDNIYCGNNRFSFPFNLIVKYLYPHYNRFFGDKRGSRYFWGDLHKMYVKYSRNYEIDNINTYKVNPYMPYKDKRYDEFSNYWYSSTFAPNQWMFKAVVSKNSIDQLEKEGGVCILYTHLGYYFKNGEIDDHFKEMIEYLGAKESGLYVPITEVMEILTKNKRVTHKGEYIPFFFKKKLELHSLVTRIKYRFFTKMDDFHFKKSELYKDKL